MSQAEVIKILGKPDKIANIELSNEIRFIYNELMVTACFNSYEMHKLCFIECTNPEVCLWNYHFIGVHSDDLMKLLKEHEVMTFR